MLLLVTKDASHVIQQENVQVPNANRVIFTIFLIPLYVLNAMKNVLIVKILWMNVLHVLIIPETKVETVNAIMENTLYFQVYPALMIVPTTVNYASRTQEPVTNATHKI